VQSSIKLMPIGMVALIVMNSVNGPAVLAVLAVSVAHQAMNHRHSVVPDTVQVLH
jgi:hypothetical protein